MITLHHLHNSRSFRIVWLMEELGLPYDLVCHDRNPDMTAPDALGALNGLKKSPVVVDGSAVLFESAAILEYVIHRYGQGRLSVPCHHLDYAPFLVWLHAAEGTCMPALSPIVRHAFGGGEAPSGAQLEFQAAVLKVCDAALAERDYFGCGEFTAADIMMDTYVGLSRHFSAAEFGRYPRLEGFLGRVHDRDGYRRAREVAEPQGRAA